MRSLSCQYTVEPVRGRIKTVTRRTGWKDLKPGTLLRLIVKGMGLKRGERQEGLAFVVVTDVRREPLRRMLDDVHYGFCEVEREGFEDHPQLGWPSVFVTYFCDTHRGCTPDTEVTRIEFRYIPGGRL